MMIVGLQELSRGAFGMLMTLSDPSLSDLLWSQANAKQVTADKVTSSTFTFLFFLLASFLSCQLAMRIFLSSFKATKLIHDTHTCTRVQNSNSYSYMYSRTKLELKTHTCNSNSPSKNCIFFTDFLTNILGNVINVSKACTFLSCLQVP